VLAEIDRRVLLKGESFPGVKVVAGKKGNKAWIDEGAAEAWAREKAPNMLFRTELITPTQAMDKLKKQDPALLVELASLYTQAEGKPAVVPESDSRPAISHRAQVDDFADETQPAVTGAAAGQAPKHPFRD
jgi:hypothetical protein